jgi:hypothetical protein
MDMKKVRFVRGNAEDWLGDAEWGRAWAISAIAAD